MLDLEFPNGELIWLQLDFPHKTTLLCTVYRPPNATKQFWEQCHSSIERAIDISSNIVIVGDINVDLLTITRHHVLSEILSNFNLVNIINKPTRIGNTRESLLDPIIISEQIKHIESEVLPIDRSISDHDACLVRIEINSKLSSSYKRDISCYNRANLDEFNRLIEAFSWEEMFAESENVDEACTKFTNKFLSMARTCIPSKLVTIRPNDKPWMTSELRKNIRIRDRLHKKNLY